MTQQEYMEMYSLVGAAMEVYNQLGRGMEEPIYQEALQRELTLRSIPFEREKQLHIWYKGVKMDKCYFADFYSNGVMVELKSVAMLLPEHRAQLLNYMRISKTYRGLLINFGERSLHCERYLYLPDDDGFVLLNEANYKEFVTSV